MMTSLRDLKLSSLALVTTTRRGLRNIYFAAFQNRKLVGVALLKTDFSASPSKDGLLCYVSVRNNHFGSGIGRALLRDLLSYCADKNIKVVIPTYSVRGWMHLKTDLDNIAKELNVEILNKKTQPTFYDWKSYEGYTAEEYDKLQKGFSTLYEGLN